MSKKLSEKFSREDRQALASRIQSLRHNASIEQEELASMAGIARGTLSAIENGRTVPQAAVLVRIYEALGMDIVGTQFSDSTNQSLAAIGALLEAIPEARRSDAVSEVIVILSRAVRKAAMSNVVPMRDDNASYLDQVDLSLEIKAASNDDGGQEEYPNG
ncbi:helix-turn-helix domain-containing protein [Mycetocola saprophilus]|uniref:helix-turn-helix domain-containing protein n=1 Tax=Mycetocola saprophilus TaxID=76636 RepID=UPI0004BF5C17|nr:helix-turn-helix transcriptional regulator [Mycetocola saprophilus]